MTASALPLGALYAMPRNLVLAASAGTGKTHALVGVIVHLLLGARAGRARTPVDPARIVATTFSRKAASEIRARVAGEVDRLAEAPASSVYAAGLRAVLGDSVGDAEIARRARRALERLPHARFGTLHSYATGIVQKYAVELGLGPGFDLANEADARLRAEDAIAGGLERRLAEHADVVRSLADAAGGMDRLVVALRQVLARLEEDGRAARHLELDARDAPVLEARMRELAIHARAISSHPRAADLARDFGAAWDSGDPDQIEDAAAMLTGLPATMKKTPELEAFFLFRADLPGQTNPERGRRLARAWRARGAFAAGGAIVRDVLAEAEEEVARSSRTRATLGFGEVLRAARELLQTQPGVAEEASAAIDALLIDEFQDTSRVQRDLIQLLWARRDGRVPAGQVPPLSAIRPSGLLVVGDRKQSIYGFRGADVGVFAELAVGLAGEPAREALGIPPGVTWEPGTPVADFHALRHNRRSVPSILAFANAFSARRFQPGDPPPELFEIDYVPATEDLLVPPEGAPASGGEVLGPASTWLRVRPKGNASTRLEEALVIAERICSMRAEGARAWRDIAVLATTNGMLDAVAFALAQADVPYVVSGKSFFRTREVSDLAAMLRLVLDPGDRRAALEVLRGPWAGVHDETLLALALPGRGLVPPSAWCDPPRPELLRDEDRPALAALSDLVSSLSRSAGRIGPGAVLREAMRASGLDAVLASLPRGQQRVANVQKLLAMADRQPDARAFQAWLEDAMEQEAAEAEAATFSDDDDAVRLLTVHASKGLDFPVVFIPEIGAPLPRTDRHVARVALGAGDTPNVLTVLLADDAGFIVEPPSYARAALTTRRRERAERQRLAYVAVTRAEHMQFFVGGRGGREKTGDAALDGGMSTLAVLEAIAAEKPELLAVYDVDVPPPRPSRSVSVAPVAATAPVPPRRVPAYRALPIAPTALADFDHCARRFELVHLLGLPEHARGRRSRAPRVDAELDARAQGTLAHAVLEQLPIDVFLSLGAAAEAVTRALGAAGVPEDHPQHAAIAGRAMRFLETDYARAIRDAGATIHREVAFVLGIDAVTLRGSMDLVVAWPSGDVDVVDYKSARSGDTSSYAFQLDVYALAARERFPGASRLRAGLSFLGAGSGEPVWRTLEPEQAVRERIAALGAELMEARWSDAFPRVEIGRCEKIHCGFIGRCHPERERPAP